MNCYVICEPTQQNAISAKKLQSYLSGIKMQLRKSNSKLIVIEPDQIEKFTMISASDRPEQRPIILVVGITFIWTRTIISELLLHSVHPIVLSPFRSSQTFAGKQYHLSNHISTVSFDDAEAISRLLLFFINHGVTDIAYFGYHPNINSHKIQLQTFTALKELYQLPKLHPYCDCYANLDYLDTCSNVFISRVHSYQAVICSTPEYAVKLIHDLRINNISKPDFHIATIGSSPLLNIVSPKVTTYCFDEQLCGQTAVKLYMLLEQNPQFSKLEMKITGTLRTTQSTPDLSGSMSATLPPHLDLTSLPVPDFRFVDDTELNIITKIEHLLYKCDEIDLDYINSILKQEELHSFCERHYISEGALNYRIRKMCEFIGVQSKSELVAVLFKWLSM